MQKVVKNYLPNLKLTPRERLASKAHFSTVFQEGVKFVTSAFVFYYKENTLGYARLGVIVSKRSVRRAVDRHKVKRKVRAVFRLCKQSLGARDLIVIARRYDRDQPLAFEAHLEKLCKRFQN